MLGAFPTRGCEIQLPEEELSVPTIFDVAKRAGVSKSSVSRVLNGGPVSPKTRKAVLEAIEELGYRPSVAARGLVTKRSQTVGFVLTDVADPYYSEIIRGVEAALSEKGYSLILCSARWDNARELNYIRMLAEHRVDGLLVLSSLTTANEDALQTLSTEMERPVVFLDRSSPGTSFDSVGVDDFTAAAGAVRHLVNLGHARIAHVTGPLNYHSGVRRLQGYRHALAQAGIEIDESLIAEGNFTKRGGYEAAVRLLSLKNRPTAIFAANDISALGVWQAAREFGLRIPEDLALVGFDDIELLNLADIPLTTVRQPRYDFGYVGTQILLTRIEESEKPKKRRQVILPTELIIRRSCGHHLALRPGAS